ncbi:MAG TPA: hypothetical protein PLE88_07710, partial [Anaerohalosphaeraceae bacterium]|nr:hypothetical protein [Anaerohalosphaeraceae bacterium]
PASRLHFRRNWTRCPKPQSLLNEHHWIHVLSCLRVNPEKADKLQSGDAAGKRSAFFLYRGLFMRLDQF